MVALASARLAIWTGKPTRLEPVLDRLAIGRSPRCIHDKGGREPYRSDDRDPRAKTDEGGRFRQDQVFCRLRMRHPDRQPSGCSRQWSGRTGRECIAACTDDAPPALEGPADAATSDSASCIAPARPGCLRSLSPSTSWAGTSGEGAPSGRRAGPIDGSGSCIFCAPASVERNPRLRIEDSDQVRYLDFRSCEYETLLTLDGRTGEPGLRVPCSNRGSGAVDRIRQLSRAFSSSPHDYSSKGGC
jgi:hypothetical protein